MTARERTYRPTEQRRAAIIDATIRVLAEAGSAGTTFSRIREQAQLSSTRLISYHFATKEALMAAVVEKVVAGAAEVMPAAMDAEPTYRGKLAAYIRSNLQYLARDPLAAVAVTEIVRNGATPGRRDGEDVSAMLLAVLLAQGQGVGELAEFDPAIVARSIRATIDAIAAQLRPDHPLDADEIEQVVALFDRATTSREVGR